MTFSTPLRSAARPLFSLLVLTLLFSAMSLAFAGTTGTLSGVAVDAATNVPIAGAKVTVTGPSAVVTATTDKSGHFTFASLPPDTYSVSLDSSDYHTSLSGVEVVADNVIVVTVSASK